MFELWQMPAFAQRVVALSCVIFLLIGTFVTFWRSGGRSTLQRTLDRGPLGLFSVWLVLFGILLATSYLLSGDLTARLIGTTMLGALACMGCIAWVLMVSKRPEEPEAVAEEELEEAPGQIAYAAATESAPSTLVSEAEQFREVGNGINATASPTQHGRPPLDQTSRSTEPQKSKGRSSDARFGDTHARSSKHPRSNVVRTNGVQNRRPR